MPSSLVSAQLTATSRPLPTSVSRATERHRFALMPSPSRFSNSSILPCLD